MPLQLRLYGVAAAVLILDQITKAIAQARLEYAVPQPLLPFLNFTLHFNDGAAFSFLSGAGGWQRWFFAALALAVSTILMVWLWRLPRQQWLLGLALALVLGGALGNLWDRLLLGYVIDFVSLHYAGRFFPTFNVADSAITVGAVLLFWDSLRGDRVEEGD